MTRSPCFTPKFLPSFPAKAWALRSPKGLWMRFARRGSALSPVASSSRATSSGTPRIRIFSPDRIEPASSSLTGSVEAQHDLVLCELRSRLANAPIGSYLSNIDIWPDDRAVSPWFDWAHVQTLFQTSTNRAGCVVARFGSRASTLKTRTTPDEYGHREVLQRSKRLRLHSAGRRRQGRVRPRDRPGAGRHARLGGGPEGLLRHRRRPPLRQGRRQQHPNRVTADVARRLARANSLKPPRMGRLFCFTPQRGRPRVLSGRAADMEG